MINADDIKDMSPTRWVKIPGPGQFRGEGEWEEFDEYCKSRHMTSDYAEEYWNKLVRTNYVPIKVSHEKPE